MVGSGGAMALDKCACSLFYITLELFCDAWKYWKWHLVIKRYKTHVFFNLCFYKNFNVYGFLGHVHKKLNISDKSSTSQQCEGHFAHEPRAVTMKLWEPERKCLEAVPRHLQNHVVWSWTLRCSVKSCMTALNQMLFQWISIQAGLHTW
jgi:hypothetical protein